MPVPPPNNPDTNEIADRAKHGYAVGTRLLAAVQYRLATLAGTGRLDPDESMRLQLVLSDIWDALYSGTVCAVRNWDTHEDTWDEADNTYSDGRTVMTQIRIEPWEHSDFKWIHNPYTLDEGAVREHPRGTICHISPRGQKHDRAATFDSQLDSPGEFEQLKNLLPPPAATDWADIALSQAAHLDEEQGGTPFT